MSADTYACIAAAQAGDGEALSCLIQENEKLVWSVARRFFGRGAEAEDLFQLGCIGLMKAVRGFDLSRQAALSTFAVPHIAGEIRRFLRDDGPVKVSRTVKERAAAVLRVQNRLENETGESPRLSAIAQETGLDIEAVAEALQASREPRSLDEALTEDGDPLLSFLAADGEDVEEQLDLQQAIARLDRRSRQIILLRYVRDLTQQKTAQALGMTQVQVSRAEKKALSALKEALQ